jgi:hypothetical protein
MTGHPLSVIRLRCAQVLRAQCRSRATQRAATALLLVSALGVASTSARADVSVEGDIRAVRLHVSHASVSEVLDALGATFDLRHRTSIPLDRAVHGTYSGRLDQVIASLLNGYNYYLVYKNGHGVEVVVLGTPGKAVAAALPKPPLRVNDPEWQKIKARHRRPPPGMTNRSP